MHFLSNFGCKIIFIWSVNFWHQQDSNSLFKGSASGLLGDESCFSHTMLWTFGGRCNRWNSKFLGYLFQLVLTKFFKSAWTVFVFTERARSLRSKRFQSNYCAKVRAGDPIRFSLTERSTYQCSLKEVWDWARNNFSLPCGPGLPGLISKVNDWYMVLSFPLHEVIHHSLKVF